MHVIFSTTRQWNPGDEFILAGVRRVFDELGIDISASIYNRNPDVRSCFADKHLFKQSRLRSTFVADPAISALEANIKFGSFDNSIKANTDCSFADWVVLAGTPEWCNGKMVDLYAIIRRFQLPLMILGVGGSLDLYHQDFMPVIRNAKAMVVRDANTLQAAQGHGLEAIRLPCPALLCARRENEKRVEAVQKIGLIYQACADETVIWNGCSSETYRYLAELLPALAARLDQQVSFELVCHYADELPLARRDFPGVPIRYSYDSADYVNIYRAFDLVVGSRVHGIGLAASLGIPGIAISHDSRGATCEGFLASIFPVGTTIDTVGEAIRALQANITVASQKLLQHKATTMEEYKAIVAKALNEPKVRYDEATMAAPPPGIELEDLRPLKALMDDLIDARRRGAPRQSLTEDERDKLFGELRQRLIHIEQKVDAMRVGPAKR